MNEITKKMWAAGTTFKGWCRKHRINPHYARAVCAGKRGIWNVGEAARIKEALKKGGFWNGE